MESFVDSIPPSVILPVLRYTLGIAVVCKWLPRAALGKMSTALRRDNAPLTRLGNESTPKWILPKPVPVVATGHRPDRQSAQRKVDGTDLSQRSGLPEVPRFDRLYVVRDPSSLNQHNRRLHIKHILSYNPQLKLAIA
jgi:hypothetical protein